jgi:hypothetical protein
VGVTSERGSARERDDLLGRREQEQDWIREQAARSDASVVDERDQRTRGIAQGASAARQCDGLGEREARLEGSHSRCSAAQLTEQRGTG